MFESELYKQQTGCFSWKSQLRNQHHHSKNISLAQEMNEISAEERNKIYDEIHGVLEVIEESPEMVANSVASMKEWLKKLPKKTRKELDMALFLKPSLQNDTSLYLMFLRAKRFYIPDAAESMCFYFTNKAELFGNEMLAHTITFDRLPAPVQNLVREGGSRIVRNIEPKGKTVFFSNIALWDVSDPKSFATYLWYMFTVAVVGDEETQKSGYISLASLHGDFCVRNIVAFLSWNERFFKHLPFHLSCTHLCYDNPSMNFFFQGLNTVVNRSIRLRQRLHFGSIMETQHSLLSFGIKAQDCFDDGTGIASREFARKFIEERRQKEANQRQSAKPQQSDYFVYHPEPHDVLMGRTHYVREWPGNLNLLRLITMNVSRYSAVPNQDQVGKTMITLEIIQTMQVRFHARFLIRTNSGWIEATELAVRSKVSQSFRAEMKK